MLVKISRMARSETKRSSIKLYTSRNDRSKTLDEESESWCYRTESVNVDERI